ncbi:MAG TPA: DUF3347 domain-containing protein [Verrucomicrobiae bacterium]|nr:DUF3347 domain-containing protein [Verrucomicrobiae bacterium]
MKITKTIFAACAGGLLLANIARADDSALSAPVRSVYDNYLKIQAALAGDSTQDIAKDAGAIVKLVNGDAKVLPPEVAAEARDLAKATDLSSARAAFKPLSNSLIQFLADHNATNVYVHVFCPMANADWLQADRDIKNPYLGRAMSGCGEIKN